ncbi:MAG TPA: DUF3800 domain-containing protein [Castellaniella sp.]|nr:DUF3800 domain-containing protein [Castellaniella sp.]
MAYSDYIVFVDESGDHSLEFIDPDYPVFVLSFCVFRKSDYVDKIVPAIKRLKMDVFGHDLAVLHERDLRRKTGWFSRLQKEPREQLMANIARVIETSEMTLIAILIDKNRLKRKYNSPEHPYHLVLTFGMERLSKFLREQNEHGEIVHVVCESRGAKEDTDLELAFRRVCDGDNFLSERYPHEILMADKKCNSIGLQIADLTARPVGMSYLYPDQQNRAYEVLKRKFYRNGFGVFDGLGRKVFP